MDAADPPGPGEFDIDGAGARAVMGTDRKSDRGEISVIHGGLVFDPRLRFRGKPPGARVALI
jgi:hypothetical protein